MSSKSILRKVISVVAVLSLGSQVSFAGKFHSKPISQGGGAQGGNSDTHTREWFFGDNRCKLNLDTGHLTIIGNNTNVRFSSALFNEHEVLRRFVRSVSFEGHFKKIGTLRTDLNEVSLDDVCTSLSDVEISGSVDTIEFGAFYKSLYLKEIKISGRIGMIMGWAFYGCSTLAEFINIGSVENFSPQAFLDCNSLPLKYIRQDS